MADGFQFGSVCSGIEAASVAFAPLGWKAAWLSEIEQFPSAVLAHHYPGVPNLGDMMNLPRKILAGEVPAPSMLCGGTPCQAFSVAGLRQSLNDDRGNLTLTFCEIANAIDHVRAKRGDDPGIILWENVPGVLSTQDNAFGCFLAALVGESEPLVPTGGRWTDAGAVYGPQRAAAWRVLDAQYFGLAQRRRRVFVVASARSGFDPAAVLFESDGVRRDSAPRREAREGTAARAAASLALRGRDGGATAELGDDCAFTIRASSGGGDKPCALTWPADIACTLNASFGDKQGLEDQHVNGGGRYSSLPNVSMCLNAGAMGRQDAESETLIPTGGYFDVAHTLRGEGFDASEDGTGRGTPLVPIAYAIQAGALRTNPNSGPDGVGIQADHAYTLEARAEVQCVAFSCKDHGADAGEISPTLRSMGHDGSHANGGEQVAIAIRTAQTGSNGWGVNTDGTAYTLDSAQQAVAFAQNQRDEVRVMDVVGALAAEPGAKQQTYMQQGMAVRRLTPVECERLQGFADNYTAIPWRNKPASECPDGPRYKALGNSWAVPCVRWIGYRIAYAIDRRLAA